MTKGEIVRLINQVYIPYGLEIEMESVKYEEGERLFRHFLDDAWIIGDDQTLDNRGLELTSPVLSNEGSTYILLKKISKTIKHLGATFKHASFQINFSIDDMNDEDIINLLKAYSIFENVVYRFSRGDYFTLRENIFVHAGPIGNLFSHEYSLHNDLFSKYKSFINSKQYGLSLKTLTRNDYDPIKVVEFRTPSSSNSYDIWINYLLFFSSLLTYVKGGQYEKDYIDYMFDRRDIINDVDKLLEIDGNKAKKLANSIFKDGAAREQFYNQYFK
ncbi:MAG: hypothetical protein K2G03_02140, partial [Bacilli bacterium]|nr:hypothetical protein [Bacilli bacterium]